MTLDYIAKDCPLDDPEREIPTSTSGEGEETSENAPQCTSKLKLYFWVIQRKSLFSWKNGRTLHVRSGVFFIPVTCSCVYKQIFLFIKTEPQVRVFTFPTHMAGCVVRMAPRKRLAPYVLEEEGRTYIVRVDLTRVVGVILTRKFSITFIVFPR